jgi:hypothetical protein
LTTTIGVVVPEQERNEMSSLNDLSTIEQKVRIVVDANSHTHIRISLYEVDDSGKVIVGHVNTEHLMDSLLEKILPDGSTLRRIGRSGGLYLYGAKSGLDGLKTLVIQKGYKSVSVQMPGRTAISPQTN